MKVHHGVVVPFRKKQKQLETINSNACVTEFGNVISLVPCAH